VNFVAAVSTAGLVNFAAAVLTTGRRPKPAGTGRHQLKPAGAGRLREFLRFQPPGDFNRRAIRQTLLPIARFQDLSDN
jgi:hypothetical protein